MTVEAFLAALVPGLVALLASLAALVAALSTRVRAEAAKVAAEAAKVEAEGAKERAESAAVKAKRTELKLDENTAMTAATQQATAASLPLLQKIEKQTNGGLDASLKKLEMMLQNNHIALMERHRQNMHEMRNLLGVLSNLIQIQGLGKGQPLPPPPLPPPPPAAPEEHP